MKEPMKAAVQLCDMAIRINAMRGKEDQVAVAPQKQIGADKGLMKRMRRHAIKAPFPVMALRKLGAPRTMQARQTIRMIVRTNPFISPP